MIEGPNREGPNRERERDGCAIPQAAPYAKPRQAAETLSVAPTQQARPTESQEALPESTTAESSATSGKALEPPSVLQALVSPAVITGVGNTLYAATLASSLNSSFVTLFYAAIAGLSFLNELRVNHKSSGSVEISHETPPARASRRGLIGLVREQLSLPGICLVADGIAFLGTGVGYFAARGLTFDALTTLFVCGTFSVASFAGARLSNMGIEREPRVPLAIEGYVQERWSKLPKRLQVLLQNPGALFATGNLPNYLKGLLPALAISASWGQGLYVGLAATCTASAAVLGVIPLRGALAHWSKPAPCIANGAGNFLFGTYLIYAGVHAELANLICLGCAAIAWGFSNLGLAQKLARDRS